MQKPYMPYRPCDVPKPVRFACCRAPFRWTAAQVTWVKTYYPDMRDDDVCQSLNISHVGLYNYIKATRLRKSQDYKAWSLAQANAARRPNIEAKEMAGKHVSPADISEQFHGDEKEMIQYFRDRHYKTGHDRCCDLALTYRKYDCSLEECQHIAAALYDAWCWGNPFNINSIPNLALCNSQKNRQ